MGIECSNCQHTHPEDTLYCGQCGRPLKSSDGVSFTKTLITRPTTLQKGTVLADRYNIMKELGLEGMRRASLQGAYPAYELSGGELEILLSSA